jgi:hypothetical protein
MDDQLQIRGFPVPEAGTYVLVNDVVSAIRAFAQSLPDPEDGALVHELASWLAAGAVPPAGEDSSPHVEVAPQPLEQIGEAVDTPDVFGAEEDDVSPGVDRVEIYPDPPEDPRPKWYARSIDTGGFILKVTNGSYDFEWVVQNAEERWPGIPLHLLKSAGEDSKWVEDSTRGVFPSLGPPVRRLWAGVGR